MNYIIHLNAFLDKAAKEKWMVPYHYSLYMVLFSTWNKLGFRKTFNIRRDDVMQAAKIKSKTSYYRCIKDLDAHQYLVYYPSDQRQCPASVSMIPLDGRNSTKINSPTVPLKGPLLKTNIKLISNEVSNGLPNLDEVLKFFSSNQYPREEALKFWYHHEATCWLTGNTPVQHWQPLAHKWMLHISKPNNEKDADNDESF